MCRASTEQINTDIAHWDEGTAEKAYYRRIIKMRTSLIMGKHVRGDEPLSFFCGRQRAKYPDHWKDLFFPVTLFTASENSWESLADKLKHYKMTEKPLARDQSSLMDSSAYAFCKVSYSYV